MANTDNNTPDLRSTVSALFNPGTLAAYRYALASIAPVLAIFGITGLTSGKIDHLVQYAQTFGTAALSLMTLFGILVPLLMAVMGILTSTVKKQIARVRELAANPALANAEAQRAIIEATGAIAKMSSAQSPAAVQSLVDTTVSLPQVKTIIASDAVAFASLSQDVISEKKAAVIGK